MIINYESLFSQFTSDGHTWPATLKYLYTEAARLGISNEIVELAINETFSSLQSGEQFSTTSCRCGCGIDRAATDFIHSIRTRMVSISHDAAASVSSLLSARLDALVEAKFKSISDFNKQYIKLNRPPISQRSPILRTLKKWFSTTPQS